jgi:hypothetical protein
MLYRFMNFNTLNLSKWKTQVGFHYPLLLLPDSDVIRDNQHVLLLFPWEDQVVDGNYTRGSHWF